jgi:hypothetical protein
MAKMWALNAQEVANRRGSTVGFRNIERFIQNIRRKYRVNARTERDQGANEYLGLSSFRPSAVNLPANQRGSAKLD